MVTYIFFSWKNVKILVLASLRNILELGYHVAKITVFLGFYQYFGLDMVYFVAISLHMMWYNTQTQTSYVIKDRKQENKEKQKW